VRSRNRRGNDRSSGVAATVAPPVRSGTGHGDGRAARAGRNRRGNGRAARALGHRARQLSIERGTSEDTPPWRDIQGRMNRIIGLGLFVACALSLAGCPKGGPNVTIYRKLSEPGAMQTCDANKRFRVEAKGATAEEAKAKAEAQIREGVSQNQGCGAYIWNEGSGKQLDGQINHVADYQLCSCAAK
jgi:hypothetical protein